jgi:hypothetical protein
MDSYNEAFMLLNQGITFICRALVLFGRIQIRVEREQMRNLDNLSKLADKHEEKDPLRAFLESPEYVAFKRRQEAEAWRQE